MTLCNDRQNRRIGINPTNENTIACNEANASIVNCSTSGAVAPVVSRRATTTTTLSTFSSAKLIVKKLSIVHCTLLIVFCLLFGGKAWGQSYPTVSFGSGCEPICRVVFNTIDKSSGCTTSADKYEDFTSTTTTVVAGNSYSITVYGNTDGNYTNYIKVFFDFNRDYDFDDSGESFDIGTISNCSSCSVSGTITIPSSVTSGNVRMRVVKNYGSYGTSSGGGFGQAEDYTVVVQPLQPPASVPYSCNFENTTENGNWRFGNATDGWYIGSATYNSSSKSLYVSANGGTSNSYNSTYQYIYAYRNLNFNSIGDFVVSYKWKALGETCCDYMRAFLVPASINPTLAPGSSNGIGQTGAPTGWIAVDGGNKLNGQSSWQNGSSVASISATGTYYLVFYWYSDHSNQGGSYNPTAAVDDIQVNAVEPASVPYSNDFENSTENSRWFFRNSSDGWYIGSATCSSSSKSLYVSADGGSSNSYNNTYQYIYAYRTLNFSSTGTYNVSYNWKALAETCCDYLRGFLVPATSNPNLVAGQSNGIVQTGAPSGWMAIDGGNKLNGQSSWQVYSGNVTISTAGTYYLVFYWYSDQSNQGGSYNPPAAVDNIEITPYAAEITSINCNTTNWCIGETRTVTLQVKNTGSVTWKTSATGGNTECSTMNNIVAVSYKWDEDEWYDSHPNSRIEFSANVAPNGTATISFDVEGPRKSGTNHLSFNIIRRECKWLNPMGTTSVEVAVPALTLDASPTNLCDGGESVLSMSCGQTADFYEYEPYIWDWSSNSYYSSGNQPTHIGSPVIERSIIKFTTAGNDPSIDMYNIGSYNPSIYKYVRMRYRVTGGNAGSVQIFYQSTTGNNSGGAHGDYYKNGTLTSDNQWHIVEIDMSTHPLWTSNGNIKGWRLDPCTASGVTMEIDWIGLFPDPIAIGESMLSVSPSQNTTYSACNYMVNRSCIHKATKAITVATSPTITSSPDIAATCFNSARQVTLTAGGAANVESWVVDENFEGYSGTAYNVAGPIPSGWNVIASGNDSKYSPHVGIPYPGVIAGNYSLCFISGGSDYGANNYAILPACSNPIYISFDYKFESTSYGTLTLGYITNANDASTYSVLATITPSTSNSSVAYNLSNIPSNARLAFRWTYSSSWYTCGIDNVKVKVSAPPAYTWSSTGTAGSASGATYTVTPRAGSNTYTVSAGGCSRSVSIDVLTADNITASGATTDCGTPVTLTASGIDGATYNRYSDAACSNLVQGNSSSYTPQNITSSYTYYVKATEDYLGGDLIEYDVRNFNYTGTVQEFVIPEGAEALKLEVWGAQGGDANSTNVGGKGGYSVGTYTLTQESPNKLYIVVGGRGTSDTGVSQNLAGGYNGGGAGCGYSGTTHNGGGGGGATHIATASGILSSLSSNKSSVLIVAGGGGGASDNGSGGAGGGTSGVQGSGSGGAAPGTQDSGSAWGYAIGTTATNSERGGGGGGYYGGTTGSSENYSGGGGSGYLNPALTSSSTTAGQQTGNGYARITIYKRSLIPCTSSAKSVALTVNPLPTPTVTSNSPICEGSQAQLQIQSPNNAYTYSWYSGSTNVANATSYSPTLNNDASYTVNANSTHDQIIATYDFDYTGEMQEVVAPANTSYAILEVWGAEGGRSRGNGNWMGNGGKGGYSKGKFATSSGQHFYVVVGGKGHDAVLGTGNIVISAIGGYNGGGGGNCDDDNEVGGEASGAGGGATHIAKAAPSGSTNYQLRNYSSNRNDVLIVAGGGGGASWDLNGGAGGGETGGSGTTTGTIIYGGFGYGANAVGMGRDDGVAGGGGGWQGGNTCNASSGGSNAGGGSGYIGGVTDGTTTAGVRSGNGHARIVFYRNGGGSCVSEDRSVSVDVVSPVSLSFADATYCKNASASLPAITATNPVNGSALSGSWSPATISTANAGTTNYIYTVNSGQCASGGTHRVTVVNPVSLSFEDATYCKNASASLPAITATNPVNGSALSGSWSPATISTANAGTTNYIYTVNSGQCATGGTQSVTVVNPVSLSFDDAAYCVGSSASFPTIAANDPISGSSITGLWSPSSISTSGAGNTTYTFTVGSGQCASNGSLSVVVNAPDIANASLYDYIWKGGTSTDWNTASNWYMYSEGNYSVASAIPATAKNYFIGTGECLPSSQWPSLSDDATVGNVTIAGGSVTIPANKTLSIAGSVNGTLTAQDNSTIAFVGSDDQTLSDAATFDNITIAQTATGKKIIAPNGIAVNGLATFGTGVLSGDVSFAGSASATGASLTSYIDGTVTKTLGSADFTFPLGSNGVLGEVYVPATRSGGTVSMHFNKSASADGFDVENDGYPRFWNINDMCAGDGANRFHHVSNAEYWDISSTAVVSGVNFRSIATSDIHFNDTSINQRDVEAIKFALYDGCWRNMGGTATVSGDYYELSINGVTIPATNRSGLKGSFGSTDDATLLPIELTSFTATCDGRSSLVEWTTATEKNNDYFSLERSDDAINFIEIARVAGAGNSIEPIDYSYNDFGIHGGDNYYRLVQVDYDGTRTASEIIVANCIESEVDEPEVQAYPNPFSGELTLVLDNFNNRAATIEVYDMLGKLVFMQKADAPQNSYETILNLSNLPSGAYTVRVSTTDFVINKNVVKN